MQLNPIPWLRRRARKAYNWVRNQRDGALHPGRHKAVTDRMKRLAPPRSILVVCYGNICRSPYLEAVLKRALPTVAVSSAGFVGAGRGVPDHSLTISKRRGLGLEAHLSRVVTQQILGNSDLIIVMDERQALSLERGFRVPAEKIVIAGDLDPRADGGRKISDPWRQPIREFEKTFARLDRCAKHLVPLIK